MKKYIEEHGVITKIFEDLKKRSEFELNLEYEQTDGTKKYKDKKDEIFNVLKDSHYNNEIKKKFPSSLKQGESVFVGLTIDGKPIGECELFRHYLLFVRIRAAIQKGINTDFRGAI